MTQTDATFALAWERHQRGDLGQAELLYRQVLQADSSHPDAWCFLGAVFQARSQWAEAEPYFRRALQIVPNHPSAANCLGIVLAQQGKRDEAADVFEELLRRQPDDAEAHNNLGLVREKQKRTDDALVHYRQALRLQPNFPDANNNLANIMADQGNLKDALFHYDRAIQSRPDFADAYFNRATPRFLLGEFAGGWSDYEHRWQQAGVALPKYRQPRWNGASLRGKTILLWAEQGLGDTLQFIRYAVMVKELGCRVIVACQPALIRLLQGVAGIDQLVSKDEPPPPFDVYAPLLSLPGILGTTLQNVPAQVPYLFADPGLLDQWRKALQPQEGFKVGISWQGNPTYRKDRQRSIPLESFAPLAHLPGVNLISLQKGAGTEQMAAARQRWQILDLDATLDEGSGPFCDTAAIMRVLDLVVTSDSAIAHLAGALAVPTWVALPWMPDWRWLLNRSDSPWYPTMRLFRQTQEGQWQDVFARLAGELKTLVDSRRQQ